MQMISPQHYSESQHQYPPHVYDKLQRQHYNSQTAAAPQEPAQTQRTLNVRKKSQETELALPQRATFRHQQLSLTEPAKTVQPHLSSPVDLKSKSPSSTSTSVSPPVNASLNLPVQGSFFTPRGPPIQPQPGIHSESTIQQDHTAHITHKRTKSESDKVTFKHLPGPANVALLEKDKSGSAMIAAAALAAAADMPMPLVKSYNAPTITKLTNPSSPPKKVTTEVPAEQPRIAKQVPPRPHHLMPSIHMLTNPTEPIAIAQSKNEPPVLTDELQGALSSHSGIHREMSTELTSKAQVAASKENLLVTLPSTQPTEGHADVQLQKNEEHQNEQQVAQNDKILIEQQSKQIIGNEIDKRIEAPEGNPQENPKTVHSGVDRDTLEPRLVATDPETVAEEAAAAKSLVSEQIVNNPDNVPNRIENASVAVEKDDTTSEISTDEPQVNREIKVTLKFEPGFEVRRSTIAQQEIPAEEVKAKTETEELHSNLNKDNSMSKSPIDHYRPPLLESYKVDPDLGLIGCVCGIDDDDGFTIQCDICFRWQHCLCMGFMTNEEVPEDEYKCYYCDPEKWGKFNADKCRAETLARITNKPMVNLQVPAQTAEKDELSIMLEMAPGTKEKRKSLSSEKVDKSEKKRKVEETLNVTDAAPEQGNDKPVILREPELPNPANQLLDDGISAENYQSVYFKLKSNDYKKSSVRGYLENIGYYFQTYAASLSKAEQLELPIQIQSMAVYKQTKFCKIILPNQIKYLQAHRDHKIKGSGSKFSIQVKPYNENLKQKFNAVSKLGLFLSLSESSSSRDSVVVPQGTPIIEYLGEINFLENYVEERINQYKALGCTKQYVIKTTLNVKDDTPIDLVLDSRFVGNESRFIRKACPNSANCKIVPIYIHTKNLFKFVVVTKIDIELTEDKPEIELSLDWNWDEMHPIQKLYKEPTTKFEQLSEEDRKNLVLGIDNLLPFVECACNTLSSNYQTQCAVFKVKKAITFLLRSQRKASQISNINLGKSKEELLFPHRTKQYHSWTERLGDRDKLIRMKLSVSTSDEIIAEADNDVEGEEEQYDHTAEIEQADENTAESLLPEQEVELSEEKSVPTVRPQYKALLKQPYKKLLFAKTKVRILNIYSIPPSSNGVKEALEVPIPVVPEVQLQIEKQISEELNSNITELKQISPEVTEAKQILPTETVPPVAQPTVKKLLFADYKKKMK